MLHHQDHQATRVYVTSFVKAKERLSTCCTTRKLTQNQKPEEAYANSGQLSKEGTVICDCKNFIAATVQQRLSLLHNHRQDRLVLPMTVWCPTDVCTYASLHL